MAKKASKSCFAICIFFFSCLLTVCKGGETEKLLRLNISQSCLDSIQLYQETIQNNTSETILVWKAQKNVSFQSIIEDAQSMSPVEQCQSTRIAQFISTSWTEFNVTSFRGVYCKARLTIERYSSRNINESKTFMEFCAPNTCSLQEIEIYLAAKENALSAEIVSCQSDVPQTLDTYDVAIICALFILGLLVALGTALNAVFIMKGENPKRKLDKALVSFSIYENTIALMNTETPSKSITCIYGLRFLAICFIVQGHTAGYYATLPGVEPESVQSGINELWYQAFRSFNLWTDTFFLLSGLLLTYHCLKKFEKIHNQNESSKSFTGSVVNFASEIGSGIVRRYWRLTPTLAFVLCINIISDKIGSIPYWSRFGHEIQNCRRSWWRVLFHVNNIHISDLCLNQTWFLGADFQLYIFSFFLLIFLSSRMPKVGIVLSVFSVIASIIATGVVKYYSTPVDSAEYSTIFFGGTITNPRSGELIIYSWPFFRAGSFLVGVLLGYIIIKRGKLNIPSKVNAVLWIICLSTLSVIILTPYFWSHGHMASQLEKAIYTSLHRVVWSICWAYIILSCHSGHFPLINNILSWEAFIPLSKMSYHVYLVHVLFIYFHDPTEPTITYFSHYHMFILFFGFLGISFLFGYISAICVEMPFSNLENILWPRKRYTDSENDPVDPGLSLPSIENRDAVPGPSNDRAESKL